MTTEKEAEEIAKSMTDKLVDYLVDYKDSIGPIEVCSPDILALIAAALSRERQRGEDRLIKTLESISGQCEYNCHCWDTARKAAGIEY